MPEPDCPPLPEPAAASAAASPSARIRFGAPEARLHTPSSGFTLDLPVPHLGGPREEIAHAFSGQLTRAEPHTAVLTGNEWLAAAFLRPAEPDLRAVTQALYEEILSLTRGWNIARIWNYVPHINSETNGLENYRHFNFGRWQACQAAYGEALAAHLPAASAVGTPGSHLAAVLIATRLPLRRLENPLQVPAWRYPATYGPRAPVFVRATALEGPPGQPPPAAWISGTASIRGHETLHVGHLAGQIEVTLDNIAQLLRTLGLPPIGTDTAAPPFLKVYVRHPTDTLLVQQHLAAAGWPMQGTGAPMFLQADICRAELALEIEAAFGPR